MQKIGLVIGLLIICTACQVGKIPCPKIKTVKLHKSFRPPSSSLLSAKASAAEPEVEPQQNTRPTDSRYVKNVSVEEWDCPRPGAKRYMPKSVKENIRKNRKKIESDMKQQQADSLSTR